MISPRLLNRKTLAEYLNRGVDALDKFLRETPGFPRGVKIGGSKRKQWDKQAVDAWIDAAFAKAAGAVGESGGRDKRELSCIGGGADEVTAAEIPPAALAAVDAIRRGKVSNMGRA